MNDPNPALAIFHSLTQTSLIQIGLILALAYLSIFISQKFFPWLADEVPSRFRLFLLGLVPVTRLVIIIAAFVMIIPLFLYPTFANLVTLLGALGIAIGFALKDYVSSLIAGIVTLYERPYQPGDWIEVNGAYGEVRTINMRTVEIVTPDDTVVQIPHLQLWHQLVFNSNDGGQNLQCTADFYLNHQHDVATVRELLYDTALTSNFLQIRKQIVVAVINRPWGRNYRLKAYPIDPRHQFDFVSDLTVRGKSALDTLGVDWAPQVLFSEGKS